MGNISICVCVWFFFFLFWKVGGESNLLGPVHPGNRLVLVNNVFKMLLLVEIAVNVSPCSDLRVYLALLSPVWTWPWMTSIPTVHWKLLIEIQFGDSETGEVEWKFRVVQGANWNSSVRATFQRLTISIWGMHTCDSYFAGDDRNLLNIQECLLVFQ